MFSKIRSPRKALVVGVGTLVALSAFAFNTTSASAGVKTIGNQSAECRGYDAFKTWDMFVDGKKIAHGKGRDNLTGQTKPGATLKLTFTLNSNCNNMYVGLDSYTAPSGSFVPSEASKQKRSDRDADTFKADGKSHTLSVKIPDCYYQVDAYTNGDFKPGDYSLDHLGRFLGGDNGGTKKCVATTTTAKPTTTTAKPTTTTTAKVTTTTVKQTTTTVKPTTTTTTPVVSPTATAEQVCEVGTTNFKVTYTNGGTTDQTFTAKVGSTTLDTVTVKKGAKAVTKTYTFDKAGIAKNKSGELVVTAGGEKVLTQTITNDCIDVAATVTQRCDVENGTGAVLSFTNNGKLPEVFTITSNGKEVAGSPLTVPAGTTQTQQLLRLDEDTTADIKIVGKESGLVVEKTVKIDCVQVESSTTIAPTTSTTAPAQVLGEQVTRPQLAMTGTNVTPMVVLGSLLLMIGAGILGARKRFAR